MKKDGAANRTLLGILLFLVVLGGFLPLPAAYANSAEPPALIILVNHPPEDLVLKIKTGSGEIPASFQKKMWEGSYCFYRREIPGINNSPEAGMESPDEAEPTDGNSDPVHEYVLLVTGGERNFECRIPTEDLRHYNNVFTLDLKSQSLLPGTVPYRSALLVALRVGLTLLLEGAVFWCFGYRMKSSWILFFAINLLTQTTLNLLLGHQINPSYAAYILLFMMFLEAFVFLFEMIAFPVLLKEHSKKRALLMAFSANLISLWGGAFIIMRMPI